MQAEVVEFRNEFDVQTQLNEYLANWKTRWPNRRILHITAHERYESRTHTVDVSHVRYTFFYIDERPDGPAYR